MAGVFTDEFVQKLVDATIDRPLAPGLGGLVGLAIGKDTEVVIELSEGRVVGPASTEPGVTIPFTADQVDDWTMGRLDLGEAYMKGDLKPVGATGALLAALEIFDDPTVVAQLA